MAKTRGGGVMRKGGEKDRGKSSKRGVTNQVGEDSKRGGVRKQGRGRVQGGGRVPVQVTAEGGATVGGRRRKLTTRRGRNQRGMDHNSSVVEDVTMEDATVVEPTVGTIEREVETSDVVGERFENGEDNDVSSDNESVEGDDCEVTVEDTARYREGEAELNDEIEGEEEEDAEIMNVEICNNIEEHFGEEARECTDESGNDSGDDIWNDDNILDP